ncbi:OmpW family outer membrane protein [Alteromonas flava]|uniref:OmpW family outer membrane protein n=1 Tax=Alteromonas flava TaxID=2048003 RepID=UPI000C28662D|nr:OmpW family outer membrane protein [Alteromonas flava]
MKKTTLALALAAMTLAPAAFAYEKGDILVRGGLTTVAPDDSSTNILVGGADFALGGQTVGGVNVDSNTQLGLNVAYFFTPHWNVEVLAATPFSHDIDLGDGTNLASTKHLPPTVTANYFFADPAAKFQPYVGVGLNYTIFFDEEFNGATAGVIETATGGAVVSDLDLDASFGFSAQAGADYFFSDDMFINASVRYIDIETEADFKVSGSDIGKIESVTIDPWVYTVSIGYKF